MLTTYRSLLVSTVFIFSTSLTACSFSTSSDSFSESSGSASDSISKSSNSFSGSSSADSDDSSEPTKKKSRYQNEVTDYTSAYLKSGSIDTYSFQRGLSKIATKQRIINWEQNRDTYIGIGRALKKARLSNMSYEAFKKDFAKGDYQKMQDIQTGFDSE
ncbi:MAG: putative lipoprotein [Methylococcales bacterium]|nr:putative lipoprotein [Methylococcales bacterium]